MKILIDSDMVRVPSNCHECFCGYGGFCAVAPSETDGLCADEDKPEWCPITAQEPRVMTLEEVAGRVALERETPIYMEFGYMATHAGQVIGLNPKYMYFDDENGLSWDVCEGPNQGKKDGVSLDEYNDIWRCWTSRPDEKRRGETPWEQ